MCDSANVSNQLKQRDVYVLYTLSAFVMCSYVEV